MDIARFPIFILCAGLSGLLPGPTRRVLSGEAEPPAAGPIARTPPGMKKGALQEVAKPLGRLLCLSWDRQGIKLDREVQEEGAKTKEQAVRELTNNFVKQGMPEEQAAKMAEMQAENGASGIDGLFGEICEAGGSRGGGLFSSGEDRSTHFQGAKLSGRMETGRGRFRVILSEQNEPGCQIDFQDDGDGRVRFIGCDADDTFFLRLTQRKDGGVRVILVRDKDVFQAQAASFAALRKEHRGMVEKDLLPLLRHLGVTPPPMPSDPAVKAQVLSRLCPPGDGERKAFGDAVRGLDDNDFQAREAASSKLGESYGRFREAIEKLLREGKLAPEAKNRLQSLAESKGREFKRIDAAVAALGLLEDPGFLVGLLDEAKGPDAEAVTAQLKKVTGQDLPGAAAWREWWEEKQKVERGNSPGNAPAAHAIPSKRTITASKAPVP
ncbi:MAG TPA: hypothetical protein PK280_02965 [Planctomycetota bacterium]|nr:hypothetical protein [Planctomycetota bacterium]